MQQANPSNNFHYNKALRERASLLRNNMTKGEVYMWKYILSRGKFLNFSFLRQRPVLWYIADFMCKELMLIIEIDGVFHQDEDIIQKDLKRQDDLEQIGFTVLRFSDWEVINEMHFVLERLTEWVEKKMPLR